jgi:hypothetical protein
VKYANVEYRSLSLTSDDRLRCPHCGSPDGMEDGDTVYATGPDHDAYDSPAGTRGGWLELRGICSLCRTPFSLVIGNHKGMLCLNVAKLPVSVWGTM